MRSHPLALATPLVPVILGLVLLAAACDSSVVSTGIEAVSSRSGPDTGRLEDSPTVRAWQAGDGQLRPVADPRLGDELQETPTPKEHPRDRPHYIVHEWGTYTSVQSSLGETLDGMHHEEEVLPPFVHGRCSSFPDTCFLQRAVKDIENAWVRVSQKLETPVIYFYSDEPRQVDVAVDFPKGVISQWFPAAAEMAPALGDIDEATDGYMRWLVEVDPAIDTAAVPWVPEHDIWAPSRRTEATPIRVGAETEHLIFYRGVGDFEMPVRITSTTDAVVHVGNESDERIPSVILLHVREGFGGVNPLGAVAARSSRGAKVPAADLPMEAYLSQARAALMQALVASGLYTDEAAAMVDTWEHSYFQTPGLRALYIAPRPWTDELLPMRLDPEPEELERTLVGRIEILTPGEEADVLAFLQHRIDHYGEPMAFMAPPESLGRFAEPKVRRACQQLDELHEVNICKSWARTLQEGHNPF